MRMTQSRLEFNSLYSNVIKLSLNFKINYYLILINNLFNIINCNASLISLK